MPSDDAITRNLAMQVCLASGHLPPHPDNVNYDYLMTLWNERYESARVTAEQMLAAATEHERLVAARTETP